MQPDASAVGTIWHRRYSPRPHAFRYQAWFALVDVDRIERRCAVSRWWSVERFNLVSFRRADFIAPHNLSLSEAVRCKVLKTLGFRPSGTIRMLTHLRQWGVCFNPVTFYFCEEPDGRLASVVAEVHNTPWNERHAYVLDAREQSGFEYRFEFDKDFHVSPFLPMEMRYQWRFKLTEERIGIHMAAMLKGATLLEAGTSLYVQPLSIADMRRLPLRFPLMTARVLVGIYWQAFRLWFRKIPFFPHSTAVSGKREG